MLYDLISPFTQYLFMQKALLGCISVAMAGAPVGLLLLLRKMSLMGEALSHGIFPGIVLAFLLFGFWIPGFVICAIGVGLILSLISRFVHQHSLLYEDASFSALYLLFMAVGVVILYKFNGNFNILHLLFGDILSIQTDTLIYMSGMNCIVLLLLWTFRKPILYDCFDPTFMFFTNKNIWFYHIVIWGSITTLLVLASLAVGTLMSMGLIMLPAVTSRLLFKDIYKMTLASMLIGVTMSYVGLLWSFYMNWPAGASIIVWLGIVFLSTFIIKHILLIKR